MREIVPCPLVMGCKHPNTCRAGNICLEYLTERKRTPVR